MVIPIIKRCDQRQEKRREKNGRFIKYTGRRAKQQDSLYHSGVWWNTNCRMCGSHMGHYGGSCGSVSGSGSESQC